MFVFLCSEQSPFYLMLLSSKAGGVGLTLTGGSRLILLEVRYTSYGIVYTVDIIRCRAWSIDHLQLHVVHNKNEHRTTYILNINQSTYY